MTLTKSERNKVYIKAYSSIEEGINSCLCAALINSDEDIKEAYSLSPLLGIDFNKIIFPEFSLLQPSEPKVYWFSGDNQREERLTALALMIAMTE